jgi:type IV secretory pathway ATPase VirB11/archaellum biosynthesis ATPase
LIKKHVAVALSLIITVLSLALPSHASTQSDADIEKMRARVRVLSTSSDSQVEVTFRDKTKVKGYITAVEPVSFTLKDPKDRKTQSISYAEVASVSKANTGVSTKTWLIIGGVAAGVVTTWLIVKPAVCDGGAQTRGAC